MLSSATMPVEALGHKRVMFWLGFAAVCILATALFFSQGRTMNHQRQRFTGYPPSVYMGFFQACSSDRSCTRTEEFRVDTVRKGCCVLGVTNGDGRGNGEVNSFEVALNGKRVIPVTHSRFAQAAVDLQDRNKIEVTLTGEPNAKLFVLISYDPRQNK